MDAACEAQRYRTTSGSELVGGEAGTSSLPLAVLYRSHSSANRYISFGDQVIAREVSNVYAIGLPQTTFTGATISLSGTATAHVSAASYLGGSTASDSIVSAFGAELATRTETATTTTLPTTLAGTSGLVKDSKGIERLAPLFFV